MNTEINGKQTAIVFAAADKFNGSQNMRSLGVRGDLDSCEEIAAIIDPRRNPGTDWIKALKDQGGGKPVHLFLLVPSATSSEKAMLCAELGVQNFSVAWAWEGEYGSAPEKVHAPHCQR